MLNEEEERTMMINDSALFIGVDGGGTHTRVAIVDAAGELLGEGSAGPGNYQAVGVEEVSRSIEMALTETWRSIGQDRRPVRGAFLGMAGVVTPHDRGVIEGIAKALGIADQLEVDHDIRIALAGGLECREGVALIAGTGSSCYGRRDDGRSHRAGGWGHLVDDAGSGYRLVLDALAAIVRAIDGRGDDTSLRTILLDRLGITDPNDLLRLLGSEALDRTELAALAPDVINAAEHGDHVALDIIHHGADELARMVEAVVASLANPDGTDWSADLVIVGGLATSPFYRQHIASAITERTSVVPHEPLLRAVVGAALLARKKNN